MSVYSVTEQSIFAYGVDPMVRLDPFPYYQQLLDQAPVYHRQSDDITYVSRYTDLITVYRSDVLSYNPMKSRRMQRHLAEHPETAEESLAHLDRFRVIMETDPPEHTRLRLLLGSAFTPKLVNDLEPWVHELADGLIDDMLDRGTVDFAREFAFLLPVFVICRMLGVSTDERDAFAARVEAHLRVLDPSVPLEDKIGPQGRLLDYIEDLIERHRVMRTDDVITALIDATEEGDRLSQQELVSNTMALLAAGFETTQNLLTNGMLAFLRHPDQLKLLADDPTLGGSAVEEVLRFDPPSPLIRPRSITADLVLSGGTLRAGDAFTPVLPAANRDPSEFDRPQEFDITRPPTRHLSFGHGPHYCIGRTLARLEGRAAFTAIARRVSDIALAVDETELSYRPSIMLRSLDSLPVVCSPA